MKRIALLSHRSDVRSARALAAALRPLLDSDEYHIWQNDSRTAFDDAPTQIENAIAGAWAVLVLLGAQGIDEEFSNFAQGAIQQRILEDGPRFGRLVIRLPQGAEPPSPLRRWITLEQNAPAATRATADEVLRLLEIRPRWSSGLAMDAATACFPDSEGRPAMLKHFSEVAQMLSDGKPLTLMIGPYVSVEDADDGSCPSSIRRQLLDMIKDQPLREMLSPLEAAAKIGGLPPLLWHDHLATLCLLSGCTREEVARAIDQAIGAAPGDASGPPQRLFSAIGTFVEQMRLANPRRIPGLPAVTVLTVCPGLRIERALIAHGSPFERAALMLGSNVRPELHRARYRATQKHAERAAGGMDFFMPDGEQPGAADEIDFVRLVKLFGSRDLDQGVPSGDFAQAYDLTGQLKLLLEDFVATAGTGPYVVLGGGLGTPPLQAAHAVLLRNALEKPERRPRLAIVPRDSASPDPLRQAEIGRIARLTRVRDSGFDRLQVVLGDPVCFLNALTVAFGGEAPAIAA